MYIYEGSNTTTKYHSIEKVNKHANRFFLRMYKPCSVTKNYVLSQPIIMQLLKCMYNCKRTQYNHKTSYYNIRKLIKNTNISCIHIYRAWIITKNQVLPNYYYTYINKYKGSQYGRKILHTVQVKKMNESTNMLYKID